jgi:hypothetical protein
MSHKTRPNPFPLILNVLLLSSCGEEGPTEPAEPVVFQRTYGGPNWDAGFSVQQTSDGGYVIAGGTSSFGVGGSYDVWLIRTNRSGDTLWTRTYGGSGTEIAYGVQQTADGGFIISGYASSVATASDDAYLIRTDPSGIVIWSQAYGDTLQESALSVQQTSDGGYVFAGRSDSYGSSSADVLLVKTDNSGGVLWTRSYGGAGWDEGSSVQQTADGGYIVVGSTDSFGANQIDVYVVKTNSSGDTLWTRTYGGGGGDVGSSVRQVPDGGYLIVGSTGSFGAGTDDVYLVRTDASGTPLWTKTYGGSSPERGYSVWHTSDGGFIISGSTESYGGGSFPFVYLIRTNSSGDTLWTRTYGGTAGDQYGLYVQQTSDGGYIVVGHTESFGAGSEDVYLIKTNEKGLGPAGVR